MQTVLLKLNLTQQQLLKLKTEDSPVIQTETLATHKSVLFEIDLKALVDRRRCFHDDSLKDVTL